MLACAHRRYSQWRNEDVMETDQLGNAHQISTLKWDYKTKSVDRMEVVRLRCFPKNFPFLHRI